MRPSQLEEALYFHAQYRQPVIVLSAPGKGKSTIIRRVFRRIGLEHATINLALSDGTDFRGLPHFVDREGSKAVQWIKEHVYLQKRPLAVFVDETFQGQTQVLNSVAPLFLEYRIDDVNLQYGSWVVGASNRAEDKAGTNRVPSHIPNRVTILYGPDTNIDDWATHMLDGGSSEDIPMAEYQEPLPLPEERDYRVVAFFRMKPDALNDFDPSRLVNCTERQAEWVAQFFPVIPDDLKYPILSGRIGEGTAAALTAFVKIQDKLPSKEKILLDPKRAPVPADEPSALYLITGMLANAASATNFDSICTYAERIPHEFQALLVKDAMRQHPEITNTKAFVKWGVQFAEVLR